MESSSFNLWISVLVVICLSIFLPNPSCVSCHQSPDHSVDELRTYIIQVEKPTQSLDEQSLLIWYKSLLPESAASPERLLHAYGEAFSGFAAKPSAEELGKVAEREGFLRAYPNRVLSLLTTHTPDFLGLKVGRGLWNRSSLGKGIVIGVLDTGVTPGHPSFDDEGVPPPPAKWKGSCAFESGCNNKLIGAKKVVAGKVGAPPTDSDGHGTHTSSTAAGNFVRHASFNGLANGTAAGAAPLAHLAMYQVCGDDGSCSLADVLAGVDAAVKDGVDIISVSLGSTRSIELDLDPIAIASFGAVEKGVVVSAAAGNSGPFASTVTNEAPWLLTVAASTIDRSMRVTVKLGDGREILGESLDQPPESSKRSPKFSLYYPVSSPTCSDLFEDKNATGKMAVCEMDVDLTPAEMASSVKVAGGVAGVFIEEPFLGSTILNSVSNFTSAVVNAMNGRLIESYEMSTPDPTAALVYGGTVIGTSPAPQVAFFSSRGPSYTSPGILKPDICGPGVNILAAYIPRDQDNKAFEILSGTSMATPHLSGIAALVKSVHPEWSPAAIKSAIMTTSDIKDRDGKPITTDYHDPASFFDMGAGHVNPSRAADPGLVYDLGADDYIGYVCGKFGSAGAKLIVRDRKVNCSKIKSITAAQLNYPAMMLNPEDVDDAARVKRTVTNVEPTSSRYKVEVEVEVPELVSLIVRPRTLEFSEVNERKSYTVMAKWVGAAPRRQTFVFGNLLWASAKHVVRSPVVIFRPLEFS